MTKPRSLTEKYRPKTFSDIVGNGIYITVLRNTVIRQTPSEGYLFSGGKGSGKTSTARVFSKALLCFQPEKGEACNNCDSCKLFDAGTHPDYQELDAASENGVDDIREIRESARYSPTISKRRIWVFDEAHGLSRAASDALLKILEEPPPFAVFMFLTTEPDKCSETIISRCMRFDFRRVLTQGIAERLKHIAEAEGIQVEAGAAQLIAESSNGALRDAIMTLSQASLMGGTITSKLVEDLVGFVSFSDTYKLFEAIAANNPTNVIRWAEDIVARKGHGEIITAILSFLEQMTVVRAGSTNTHKIPADFKDVVTQLASNFDFQRITAMAELSRLALQDIKRKLTPDTTALVGLLLTGLMNTRNGGIIVTPSTPSLINHPTVLSAAIPITITSACRRHFEGELVSVIEPKQATQ